MDDQQKKLAEELLFSGTKKPSFAKMLYFGILDTNQIFPYPTISPEEKKHTDEFIDKLNVFLDKELDAKAIDRNASIPDSLIKGLGDLGVLGMTIPPEYGGLGLSQYAYCRAAETIARRCGATALFVNAHQSIGLKALLLFGTEEQRKRWLPPLAKGECLAAFALTEPHAGSDASGVETRAEFIPEKNVYRINGKKQWITNGSVAKVLTVMAQTSMDTPQGKVDKITAFLVNPEMPGFKVTAPSLEKVGMRGSKTANLEFQNLEVPAANIIGPPGGGLKVCLTVLDYGRTTFGATCLGGAKLCLERAIEHAKTRRQFKRPLATFSLVKQKIVKMSALVYAMEATTYMTAGLVDSGVEDFMLEAAMLKVFSSDSLWSILYDTMQIFGGRSFFTDEPFERMMRDARLNMIGEGSNEVMRAFIGVVGMRDVGMQLKSTLDALKHPITEHATLRGFLRQRWVSLQGATIPIKSKFLEEESAELSDSIRSFGFAVVKLLKKYREDVVEHQLALDRMATSAMAIYTSISVLSKIDAALESVNNKPEVLGNDLAIAKFYCRMAFDSIADQLGSLSNNNDSDIEDLADQITGIKYP